MDGLELLYNFRILCGEPSGSGWLDAKSQYYFINKGAIDVVEKTRCLTAEQSITTIADTDSYDLNANYLGLFLRKTNEDSWYIKYNDGNTNYFPVWKDYKDIILLDSDADSITIPTWFTIKDKASLPSLIEGSATAAGAASAGECTLTDSSATFVTGKVSPGDIIHNSSDSSNGYVLDVSSETKLVTALFNGTDNDWTNGDSYAIQPQPRKQILLSPPPESAGHTITVYMIVKPEPVYADYRRFRFNENYNMAALYYAIALYKMRDKDIKAASGFLELVDSKTRDAKVSNDREFNSNQSMRANLRRSRW